MCGGWEWGATEWRGMLANDNNEEEEEEKKQIRAWT